MKKLIFSALICFSLTACYAPKYQPMSMNNGYKDQQISPTEFMVTFTVPNGPKNETMIELANLRSAELCLQIRMPYFQITERKGHKTIARSKYGSTVAKKTINQKIRCLNQAIDGQYYSSQQVYHNVRAKHQNLIGI